MDIAVLIARLLLAAVFAVAGLAKLVDRTGSRQAMLDFGVPASLASSFARLLPVAELAIAIALIPVATAWYGALGALALLLVFVAGIGVNLARGRKPDCHCFGQLYSAPAGKSTLIRNGVLAAVAAFVVWQGAFRPVLSLTAVLGSAGVYPVLGLVAALVVLALLVIEGILLINLLRQNGRLLGRIEALEARLGESAPATPQSEVEAELVRGLPLGSPAPAFSLPGMYGETLTLGFLRAQGKPVLLIASDPQCGPCNALLPEIGRWQREHADKLTVALISRGTAEANRAKSTEHGIKYVLLQQDREIHEAYQVAGTPTGVLVSEEGTIGSQLAQGAVAIRELVERTVGAPASPRTPAPAPDAVVQTGNGSAAARPQPAIAKIGAPAPPVELPDLTGKTVKLAGFRGYKTLVLFWNPSCGFCSQMLDELKAWEYNRPKGAPKLLVVSTGSVESNRAMGLGAPVVLDQGFSVGNAFGASGTPSAVLVDEQGNIASQVAVGGDEVMALAGGQLSPTQGANNSNGNGTAAVPAIPTRPNVGEPAPVVKLPDLGGNTVELAQFRGHKTAVLFWNPGCGFCSRLVDDVKAWEINPPKDAPKLLVVSTGAVEANRAHGFKSPIVLDQGFTVGSAFGASGTPSAVLVDEQGNIGSQVVAGGPAVLALLGGQAVAPAANHGNNGNGLPIPLVAKVGNRVPPLKLPDLDGKVADLSGFRGTKTLILFWNPGCGFCQRMLDDLKAWEAKPPKGAPKLLVISTGTVETNRAQGFRSRVLLDHSSAAMTAFGANGTPSAVLVDSKGNVASALAVGATAVMALARGQRGEAIQAIMA